MTPLRTLSVLLTATLALTVSACTASDDGADPVSVSTGPFPATIETAFGEVVVESKPQRVVALGRGDAEVALSLGVQPVGASDWQGFGGEGIGPWSQGLYSAPPEIVDAADPDLDQIAALEPDLILDVRGSGDPERYEVLSAIAPTIAVPPGGEDDRTNPLQQTMMIATALGVPQQGGALLTDLDQAFADAAAAHPEWADLTAASATRTADGWAADAVGSERSVLLARLGFTAMPFGTAAAGPGAAEPVPGDELGSVDADVVVASGADVEPAAVADDPAWQAIPAVADGRAVVVDGDLAQAWSLATPTAQMYAIDELTRLLEEALA